MVTLLVGGGHKSSAVRVCARVSSVPVAKWFSLPVQQHFLLKDSAVRI